MNFSKIVQLLVELERATTAGGRGWVAETAERLPELAGMIVGMVVILTIYLFTRKSVEMEYKNR